MQSSSTVRSVIGYVLVVLVLGAAIFGGLQVTKNRNSTVVASEQKPVATQPKTQDKQPATQTPQSSTPKTTPTTPKNNPATTPSAPAPKTTPKPNPVATTTPPKTSSTATTTPSTPKVQTPARVPATGAEDTVVATLALMGLVLAGFMYAQSRRRLMALR